MRGIPISNFCKWLNYNGKIFIIQPDKNGNTAEFQADGTACLQKTIKGFVFKSFKSKLKWFDTRIWDTKTAWGDNYPEKVYFNTSKKDDPFELLWDEDILNTLPIGEERNKYVNQVSKDFRKASTDKANKYCIDSKRILQDIHREVVKKTGLKFEIGVSDTSYGNEWYEAYLPLTYKGKNYLLTWHNCD